MNANPCPCCGETRVVWLDAQVRPEKVKRIPVQATAEAVSAAAAGTMFDRATMIAHYDLCRDRPWWWRVIGTRKGEHVDTELEESHDPTDGT